MHCSLEDTICHVQLKDCQIKGRKLKITADKISIAPKAMTCEHLELECNLNLAVDGHIVCQYISLKSNHEVRLSSSSKLKTETLKLSGKTVFIDTKDTFKIRPQMNPTEMAVPLVCTYVVTYILVEIVLCNVAVLNIRRRI